MIEPQRARADRHHVGRLPFQVDDRVRPVGHRIHSPVTQPGVQPLGRHLSPVRPVFALGVQPRKREGAPLLARLVIHVARPAAAAPIFGRGPVGGRQFIEPGFLVGHRAPLASRAHAGGAVGPEQRAVGRHEPPFPVHLLGAEIPRGLAPRTVFPAAPFVPIRRARVGGHVGGVLLFHRLEIRVGVDFVRPVGVLVLAVAIDEGQKRRRAGVAPAARRHRLEHDRHLVRVALQPHDHARDRRGIQGVVAHVQVLEIHEEGLERRVARIFRPAYQPQAQLASRAGFEHERVPRVVRHTPRPGILRARPDRDAFTAGVAYGEKERVVPRQIPISLRGGKDEGSVAGDRGLAAEPGGDKQRRRGFAREKSAGRRDSDQQRGGGETSDGDRNRGSRANREDTVNAHGIGVIPSRETRAGAFAATRARSLVLPSSPREAGRLDSMPAKLVAGNTDISGYLRIPSDDFSSRRTQSPDTESTEPIRISEILIDLSSVTSVSALWLGSVDNPKKTPDIGC